ncbi:cytochrome P450 [Saccharata proteae CBS 121410]|uniref:Cytochrome P450 n=1 Tax=Saccharata proteae CBS 121410 TaxID=1314787 RepID=A0A9P4I3S0_9PEZI|nr:cytochrome P450 [Saccharata proteae CBS 121410]
MKPDSMELRLSNDLPTLQTFAIVFIATLVLVLLREARKESFPKISGLPEVPGQLPFVGHLHALGGRQPKNDSTVFAEWGEQLHADIFQCRIGDQRTVIVNTFAKMRDLWINRANAILDRPYQPGFVDKLGVDITGSSMTDQIRRCRQAAMRALGKPMWPKYYHLLEPSSSGLVSRLYTQGLNGGKAIDAYPYLRHIVFDLTLSITYGARFGEVNDEFMITFLRSINAISAIRNSTKSYRQWIPLLRLWPERTSETVAAERVRQKHLDVLYGGYKQRVANGEEVDCIVRSLGDDKLSEEEIHGTCVSLLQAAPDTVASGMYQCIAWLSSPAGQDTQTKAYNAILEAYAGDRDRAWQMAFREEKVPLVVSLYKETLRYFTFTPYATPRAASKDVKYGDIAIPKGMTMIINAQQINHDPAHYGPDVWEFKPDRFIGNDNPLPHVAFGAGGRICPAVAISNRIIYAVLVRLLLAFEIKESSDPAARKPVIDPIHFSDVYGEIVAHPKFFDCCFAARDEAWLQQLPAESGGNYAEGYERAHGKL